MEPRYYLLIGLAIASLVGWLAGRVAERRDKEKYPDEFWQKLSRELDAYREHEFKQEPLTSRQRLIYRILGSKSAQITIAALGVIWLAMGLHSAREQDLRERRVAEYCARPYHPLASAKECEDFYYYLKARRD